MKLTIRAIALSAFVALSAAALAIPAAWAQDDNRGPRPAARDMEARMQLMREAHEREHAQDLRTIQRLRPDQELALSAFLKSHEPQMKPPEHRGPPGETDAQTTPQRLDEMARRETERTAMRQRHTPALRAFYAALSPDQRQVFDALQRMQGGHERGGRGHGFGGPGRGPMGGLPPGGPPPHD